ncbi:MAG: NUDIX hydrolase [Planctomycetes bacterium]|nr:NUDIX hydrolase [Planctomycetota bacterium]
MKQHGPWRIVDSREVYRDPWIDVRCDHVIRPDRQPGTHCVVALKAGVSVLALDDQRHVHLTEEFHYAVGRVGWEAVSGGIEAGESPEQCAARELREELGLDARRLTVWGVVDPFTTVVTSPTALFLAEDLHAVAKTPDPTEVIHTIRLPLAEAVEAALTGRITHAPTCVLLLRAALHFKLR